MTFAGELALLLPLWRQAQVRFGRTTVGLSFQLPEAWPAFAARFLAGELPDAAGHDTPALALRFLCDDVKALYGEAAQAGGCGAVQPPGGYLVLAPDRSGRLLIALRELA